jgi:hypothetical protein
MTLGILLTLDLILQNHQVTIINSVRRNSECRGDCSAEVHSQEGAEFRLKSNLLPLKANLLGVHAAPPVLSKILLHRGSRGLSNL